MYVPITFYHCKCINRGLISKSRDDPICQEALYRCDMCTSFQVESDIESDTSVFDVKSPTRENGNGGGRRRSCTSANNNNTAAGGTSAECSVAGTPATATVSCPTSTETMTATGAASSPPTIKAVRSNSESKGTLEKCVTTTSGSMA